jgi:hypothetical protein
MIAPIVIDENKAPFVPESETRASYHCPRTNCDGHFYLRPAELGHEFVCDKCEERHRSIVRWSWVTGIAIVPSALGYVLLFYVAPWVYRGFRPGTQI